ncbi:MAG: glycosyltransferase family 2 protein [Gallionella sp.]
MRKQRPHATASKDVSVILVSYNTAALLPNAIAALRSAAEGYSLQVIIVDNASRDDSVSLIKRDYADCELIENSVNVGFGRANNQAIPLIQGEYVLLLNTDAFVAPDTLHKTVAHMDAHPECGALGVKLVGRDGVLQPSCRYFPTPWNLFLRRTGLNRLFPWVRMVDDMNWDHASVRDCDWVPGCYLLIRRKVIEQVALFDPRYFLYYEEVDWCRAVKEAGWQIHYFPDTTVVHIGGESAKSDSEITVGSRQIEALQIESELLYFRKNYGAGTVLFNVILHTLADLIIPLKRWLKTWKSPDWKAYREHTGLYWLLLRNTSWGLKPTR